MSNRMYQVGFALALGLCNACGEGETDDSSHASELGTVSAADAGTLHASLDPEKTDAAFVEPGAADQLCGAIAEPGYDVESTAFSNLPNANIIYKAVPGASRPSRLALLGINLTMREVDGEREAVLVARFNNCDSEILCPQLSLRAEIAGADVSQADAGPATLAFVPEVGASGMPQGCVVPGQTFYAFAKLDAACFELDDVATVSWSDHSTKQLASYDLGRWVEVVSPRVVRHADGRFGVRATLKSKRFTGYVGLARAVVRNAGGQPIAVLDGQVSDLLEPGKSFVLETNAIDTALGDDDFDVVLGLNPLEIPAQVPAPAPPTL